MRQNGESVYYIRRLLHTGAAFAATHGALPRRSRNDTSDYFSRESLVIPIMFSQPGKYAGGAAAGYSWQQTLHEIELKAPISAGPPRRSVKCTFGAKNLELIFTAVGAQDEPVAVGELSAVVAASDCLWSVERDDSGAALAVISLRKSVPQVWTKLFASDAEPAEAPALLDAVVRKQPQSKDVPRH